MAGTGGPEPPDSWKRTAVPPFTALARAQDKISANETLAATGLAGGGEGETARATSTSTRAWSSPVMRAGPAPIAAIRPARRAARLPVLRAIAAE